MRTLLLAVCLSLIWIPYSWAQGTDCKISVSASQGCIPMPINFDVSSSGGTPTGYYWSFGDGDSSSQKNPTHIYTKPGHYYPGVTVAFARNQFCQQFLTDPVIINDSPNVSFSVGADQQIILCNVNQQYCFKDGSSPGKDKAPINAWLWAFGDGTRSFEQNPCHVYGDTGYYQVILQAADTNGCKSQFSRYVHVTLASKVAAPLTAKFDINVYFDCKANVSRMSVTNLTDTAHAGITRFRWDYGDLSVDSCNLTDPGCAAQWTNFQHVYTKTGIYQPKLTIWNKYGCSSSFSIDTGIIVQPYFFKAQVLNGAGCFANDSEVHFTGSYHPYASYYIWDYGDPLSPDVGRLPSAQHIYKRPGVYTVRFTVKINNCIYDTILCEAVHLLGPVAHIMPPGAKWDSVPPHGSFLIPPSTYPRFFDTSCLGAGTVNYYTYSPKTIPNGDTVFNYCHRDTVGTGLDTVYDCKGKPNYRIHYFDRPQVLSVKDKNLTLAQQHVWFQSDFWPSGTVYSRPPFVDDPLILNDTMLFPWSCSGPSRIKFTNFSVKSRQRPAIDDYPPDNPDTCIHPAYPFASDSLSYLWDFREGNNNTSTKAHPDERARYSDEKLPAHLFVKNGCYWTTLVVKDPKTGCEDHDSIPVVLQQADAGSDPSYHTRSLTYNEQMKQPQDPPRRGMILFGKPCQYERQGISLDETLPSCYKRQYSMVFDSIKDVIRCQNGAIGYDWKDKNYIQKYMESSKTYQDTGWKTLGVVVSNNAFCNDTVWYHHYKYMHGAYPAVDLSAKKMCAGQTLKVFSHVPGQPGTKLYTVAYALEGDRYDTLAKIKTDTFRYLVKNTAGLKDTLTSSVQNKEWGIDDGGINFNSQYDTFYHKINYPGHLSLTSVIQSRFGCVDTFRTQVVIGHKAEVFVNNNILCLEDTAIFNANVFYYIPFTRDNDGLDHRSFWKDPDSARNGRKIPIPEQIRWDLDDDGTIDFTGPHPTFRYKKPGTYSIKVFTRDSLGCEQVLEKKNFVHVIDVAPRFGLDSPGAVRICAPIFYNFLDSSNIIAGNDSGIHVRPASWTWNFGDGSPELTVTDSTRKNVTHQYEYNGDYIVTLTVKSGDFTGARREGCSKTYSRTVTILGPQAKYRIVGNTAGCVPLAVRFVDLSKGATIREWRLGDGTIQTSHGEDTVTLIYKKPGVFCPEYDVADTITDLQGKKLYCTAKYPVVPCTDKIYVYAINVQDLTVSDSLLCAGKDVATFKSEPDTGYTSWDFDFGDGHTAVNNKPFFQHIYDSEGRYTAVLTGNGAKCPVPDSIKVRAIGIEAAFHVDSMSNDTPVIAFANDSYNGIRYEWDFGDGTGTFKTDSKDPVRHEYQRSGKMQVCLTAYNAKGCSSVVCHEVNILIDLSIPNVYTPNAPLDQVNTRFVIYIRGELEYHLDIYNRWGEKVFHSDDKNNTWDGTDGHGTLYPDGAYYYVFNYRHIGGKTKTAKGSVTLLR